jgi:hypothetical protein
VGRFCGDVGRFGGHVRPFGGHVGPFGGHVRPFGGDVRPFGGDVGPFGGDVRPFGGDVGTIIAPLTIITTDAVTAHPHLLRTGLELAAVVADLCLHEPFLKYILDNVSYRSVIHRLLAQSIEFGALSLPEKYSHVSPLVGLFLDIMFWLSVYVLLSVYVS